VSYLASRLRVAPESVRLTPLSGGVSNLVYLAEADGLRIVLKQSLEKLRVQADWYCTRERVFRESMALRRLSGLLPPGAVPTVLFEDRENFLFAMSAAEAHSVTWKSLLLKGKADPEIARRIGQVLAEWIQRSLSQTAWESEFGDQTVFHELRLDPYYRAVAALHPDLKRQLETLIVECGERRLSLVHGDFSPKNLLVTGSQATVIDWEVVHFGDPSFDPAFLTSHLFLKAFHRPGDATLYRTALLAFWGELHTRILSELPWLEEAAMRHLGGLLLARVDGKSPVEYITDEHIKTEVRAAGRSLILNPASSVAPAFDRLFR